MGGLAELDGRHPAAAVDRVRRRGGGRKPATEKQPGLLAALKSLVEPVERGDPERPLRWVSKSYRHLAGGLRELGYSISYRSIGPLLASLGYSLQGNAKTREGSAHPDRDGQFEAIARQVSAFLATGEPVISVDTKKKEPCLSGYHPHPLYVVCLLGLQARAGAGALRRRSG